jgi:hypothetical protein
MCVVFCIKLKGLGMLGKCSTTGLHSLALAVLGEGVILVIWAQGMASQAWETESCWGTK